MNFSSIFPQSFGTFIPGIDYQIRPAAYAVIFNDEGKIAVAKAKRGLFLPGGGSEPFESPEETVIREVLEETGRHSRLIRQLGMTTEYFEVENRYYRMKAVFFLAEFISEPQTAGEHPFLWLSANEQLSFFYASHNWVVQQCLQAQTFSEQGLT
jgi:8-oxo-dGTP diphosphatase